MSRRIADAIHRGNPIQHVQRLVGRTALHVAHGHEEHAARIVLLQLLDASKEQFRRSGNLLGGGLVSLQR